MRTHTTLQACETYDAARQVSVSPTGESQALLNITVISARHIPRAARRAAADTYVTAQLLCDTDATTAAATADIGSGSGAYNTSSSSRRRRSSANSSSSSTNTTSATTSVATTVRADTLYPEWRESLELKPVPNRKQTRLGVSLMDALTGTAIGSSTFPLSDPALTPGKPVTVWLDLQTPDSSTVGLLKSTNRACRLPEGCAVKCELQLRCNAGLAAAAAVVKLADAVAARRDYDASQQQQQCELEVCSDVSSQHSDVRSDVHKELFTDSAADVAAGSGSTCDAAEQQQQQQHETVQDRSEEIVSADSSESVLVLEHAEDCSVERSSAAASSGHAHRQRQQEQQQQQQQHSDTVRAETTPVRGRQRPHSATAHSHRNSASSTSSSTCTAAVPAAASNGATAAVRSNGHSVSSKGARAQRGGTHNSVAANNDCSLDSSSSSYGSGSYNSSIFRSPAARWSKPAVAKRNNSSTIDTVPWR
jgi:C2 domain